MSKAFQIHDQSAFYFITLRVTDWVDVFTRKVYRDIIIESLDFCRKEKELQIWAYVIMSNHLHLIVSAKDENLSKVLQEFKRFTAKKILKTIPTIPESRADWMMKRFEFAARGTKRTNHQHQFWATANHAVLLESYEFT